MLTIPRRLAFVLAATAMAGLAAPAAAHAAPTCTFNAGVLTVTGDGTNATVLKTDAAGDFSAEGGGVAACGLATTANTTSIVFDAQSKPATLSLRAPLDATGAEIKTTVNEAFSLTYEDLTARGTSIRTGRVQQPSERRVVDLNGDGDVDITQGTVVGQYGPYVGPITINAGPGDDAVSAAGGFAGTDAARDYFDAILVGGAGNDRLTAPGELIGGQGDDTLVAYLPGQFMNVILNYRFATGPVRMKSGASGTEAGQDGDGGTDTYEAIAGDPRGFSVRGTPFGDVLHGGPASDQLFGEDGDDVIQGGPGADGVNGGYGADELDGGAGDDQLYGQGGTYSPGYQLDGKNTLTGGGGTDYFASAVRGDTFTDLADGVSETVHCNDQEGDTADPPDTGAPDRIDKLHDCAFSAPTVSVSDAQATEGAPVRLVVTLSQAVGVAASVRLTTSDGTAKAGSDYTATQRVVTFQPGETTVVVEVPTTPNTADEGPRTLTATLDEPSVTPAIGTATATGTIRDDDPADQVTIEPSAPNGLDGWYVTAPVVRVAPGAGATETRCVLDPASPPATFADLPAGACDHVGGGKAVTADGAHTLCSASLAGTEENAVTCVSWRADTTPPAVQCQPAPAFTVGDRGARVSAAVVDTGSGAAAAVLSGPADTATAGTRTVALKGADTAGNTITATCAYRVDPVNVVLCGRDIVLVDVVASRTRVRVGGISLPKYAGQKATILSAGRRVGTATVARDGSFATSLRLPRRSQRSSIRYEARIGAARSEPLRLERRMRITSRKGLQITGRLFVPRRSLPRRVTFYRQLTCTQKRVFKTVKLSKSGVFRIRLARPVAPEQYALFRLRAKIGKVRTYTLPIAVR